MTPEGNRPPLTKDLFSQAYKATLDNYPLVRQAAAGIRHAMLGAGEDALSLEDYLRESMAKSPSRFTMRQYRQVPLYLQDVLNQASGYTREPDNYNVVVTTALELDSVLFLLLNYDTLLDSRLFEYAPLTGLDWYVDADERWSLVKLHGSVNWGWRLPCLVGHEQLSRNSILDANKVVDDHVQAGFPDVGTGDIELIPDGPLPEQRWARRSPEPSTYHDPGHDGVFYPALAVPLGADDQLVCPAKHVEAARGFLDSVDGLNLLVIGYSGIDNEVLRLLAENGNTIRRILIANGEGGSGSVIRALHAAFGIKGSGDEWVTNHTFTSLVASGDLRRWMVENC